MVRDLSRYSTRQLDRNQLFEMERWGQTVVNDGEQTNMEEEKVVKTRSKGPRRRQKQNKRLLRSQLDMRAKSCDQYSYVGQHRHSNVQQRERIWTFRKRSVANGIKTQQRCEIIRFVKVQFDGITRTFFSAGRMPEERPKTLKTEKTGPKFTE